MIKPNKDTEFCQLDTERENNSTDTRKEYKKPKLIRYGGISELVLSSFGAGADGGANPFLFS